MKISYKVFVPVIAALPLSQGLAADDPAQDEHHILDEIIITATPLERTVEQLAQPTSVLAGDALGHAYLRPRGASMLLPAATGGGCERGLTVAWARPVLL